MITIYDMINIWSINSLLLLCLCAWYCVGSCGGQKWKWSLLLSLLVFQKSNLCFWACTSFITPSPSASPHLYMFLSLISGIQKLWCLTVGMPGYILIFIVICSGGYRTKSLMSVKSVSCPHFIPSPHTNTKFIILNYYGNNNS